PALVELVKRHPEILSAAVRTKAGRLAAATDGHALHWDGHAGTASTPTHMQAAVAYKDGRWGRVEVAFRELEGGGLFGTVIAPILPLVVFVTLAVFVSAWIFLNAVLRYADRSESQLVPNRVRDTLNLVPEGILVLD